MARTTLLILFSLILFNSNSKACSCYGGPVIDISIYNAYPVIFIGKVVSVKSEHYASKYTFEVLKWYKGNNGSKQVIAYKEKLTFCPPTPRTGNIYVMYLVETMANDTAKLIIPDCSRSYEINTREPTLKLPEGVEVMANGKKLNKDETEYLLNYQDTVFLNKMDKRIKIKGVQKFYWSNNELMAEGAYLNGVPDGQWKYYNQGVLEDEGNYKNGLKDGAWKTYTAVEISKKYKPRLAKVVVYNKGNTTGAFTTYNIYNDLKTIEAYPIKGTDNIMKKFYYANGKPAMAITLGPEAQKRGIEYKRGTGPCKKYYENGQLKEEGDLKKGFKTGMWKYYDEQGNLTKTVEEHPPSFIK